MERHFLKNEETNEELRYTYTLKYFKGESVPNGIELLESNSPDAIDVNRIINVLIELGLPEQ